MPGGSTMLGAIGAVVRAGVDDKTGGCPKTLREIVRRDWRNSWLPGAEFRVSADFTFWTGNT
jgi:hypothetical protein